MEAGPIPITQKRKTTRANGDQSEDNSSHQSDSGDISSEMKRTPQSSPRNKSQYKPETYSEPSGTGFSGLGILVCLLLALAALLYYSKPMQYCSFDELKKNNGQQSELVWRHLSVGIENILNKIHEMPAVYLFVHEASTELNTLIKDIADKSSDCFGHKKKPVEMQFDAFKSENAIEDYGYAIEQYKKKVKEGQVILIAHLNEIPAGAARALHAICDVQNPIVKNVVIFLTLTVPSMNTDNSQKIAEDTLFQLWGDKLKRHELDALITRVTDQVIPLKR